MREDALKHKAQEILDRLDTVNRELIEIRLWAMALTATKRKERKADA